MQHAAFKSPLNDSGLAELGRATMNWGFADMLAEQLLEIILGLQGPNAKRQLLSPLMIGKKIAILNKCLDQISRKEIRKLVKSFCSEISDLNEGRNHAIHGFWGYETSDNGREVRSAAYSYKSKKGFHADDIGEVADRIARATISAHRAIMMLMGHPWDFAAYPVQLFFGPSPPDVQPGEEFQPLGTGSHFRVHKTQEGKDLPLGPSRPK